MCAAATAVVRWLGVLAALLVAAHAADAQLLVPGEIAAAVPVPASPGQTYALYLPSAYTPARRWPVILAFDPGGRGRVPVERYRDAAERYGYIVAGSNNSRNVSRDNDTAVVAMAADVLRRFAVDEARVYTAGMSGGARVAVGTALASTGIAGVIASSAGYPDAIPRAEVPFVLFATVGTEDFNHLEMRRLDQALKSPHRLVVFTGGHTWLSSDLAVEAVEWLEVQAIRSKVAPVGPEKVRVILARRRAAAAGETDEADRYLAWTALARDFEGLADVSEAIAEAAALERTPRVAAELRRRLDEDARETDVILELKALEARLATSADARSDALVELRREWRRLSRAANDVTDTPDRRMARRVLGLLASTVRTTDSEYRKIIAEFRHGRR